MKSKKKDATRFETIRGGCEVRYAQRSVGIALFLVANDSANTRQLPQGTVLYVGGIDSTPAFGWNEDLLRFLVESGVKAEAVSLPPWSSVEERAIELGSQGDRGFERICEWPSASRLLGCWRNRLSLFGQSTRTCRG